MDFRSANVLTSSLASSPKWVASAIGLAGFAWILGTSPGYFSTTDQKYAISKQTQHPASAKLSLLDPSTAVIETLNLFGNFEKVPPDTATLPNTSLNLKLFGIIASTLTDTSRALIAAGGKPAQAYYSGDTLPGGTKLYAINSDFVVVQHADRLEKLPLHKGAVGAVSRRRSSPRAAITETASAPVRPVPVTEPQPTTPQNVYKALEDRLAAIRRKQKS